MLEQYLGKPDEDDCAAPGDFDPKSFLEDLL